MFKKNRSFESIWKFRNNSHIWAYKWPSNIQKNNIHPGSSQNQLIFSGNKTLWNSFGIDWFNHILLLNRCTLEYLDLGNLVIKDSWSINYMNLMFHYHHTTAGPPETGHYLRKLQFQHGKSLIDGKSVKFLLKKVLTLFSFCLILMRHKTILHFPIF